MNKQPSLSSRNTLGDSNHYSSNHICNGEQNWLDCGSRWWLCRRYGGGPRKTCQIFENLMESNAVGGIFAGRGVSRASKRAKEHQNRSSDELVMTDTKIIRS